MRIFIVEDDNRAADKLRDALEAIGHEVHRNDGYDEPSKIAEEIEDFGPDLILLDHFLGYSIELGENIIGLDVVAHLKLSVPIIGIGSVGNPGDYCTTELRNKHPDWVLGYINRNH